MRDVQLTVTRIPGFTMDLWGWTVRATQAPSGRFEARWTTTDVVRGQREHRDRARALPEWCASVLNALESVDFSTLPPTASWHSPMDDVGRFSVILRCNEQVSEFELPDWTEFWTELPTATRVALERVIAILEPVAKKLHESDS